MLSNLKLISAILFCLTVALLHAPALNTNGVLSKDGPSALLGYAALKSEQQAIFTGGAWITACPWRG